MKETAEKVNLLKPFNVDRINISRDRYFHEAYVIDLPLDSMPEHIWLNIFERTWKSSRHLWDRKLFVIGDRLRLITSADEFSEKLDWVEQVIAETNKNMDKYDQLARLEEEIRIKEQIKGEMQRQRVWEEKATIDTIKETLRKRFA